MMLPDDVTDPKSPQSPALPRRYYCSECPLVSGLLSLLNLEEMMAECGIIVDHSTLHRWIIRLVPLQDKAFRRHKKCGTILDTLSEHSLAGVSHNVPGWLRGLHTLRMPGQCGLILTLAFP